MLVPRAAVCSNFHPDLRPGLQVAEQLAAALVKVGAMVSIGAKPAVFAIIRIVAAILPPVAAVEPIILERAA